MHQPTPLDRLFEIRAAVFVSGSEELITWLENAFQQFMQEGVSLDEALGLRPGQVGKRTWRTMYLMSLRDNYLRAAHAHCEGSSAWEKACNLEKLIDRFQGIWPRWQELKEPPSPCSKVYENLFHAFQIGLSVPGRARQLHEIATNGVYSLRRK